VRRSNKTPNQRRRRRRRHRQPKSSLQRDFWGIIAIMSHYGMGTAKQTASRTAAKQADPVE